MVSLNQASIKGAKKGKEAPYTTKTFRQNSESETRGGKNRETRLGKGGKSSYNTLGGATGVGRTGGACVFDRRGSREGVEEVSRGMKRRTKDRLYMNIWDLPGRDDAPTSPLAGEEEMTRRRQGERGRLFIGEGKKRGKRAIRGGSCPKEGENQKGKRP